MTLTLAYETLRNLEKRVEALEMFINAAIEAEKNKEVKK